MDRHMNSLYFKVFLVFICSISITGFANIRINGNLMKFPPIGFNHRHFTLNSVPNLVQNTTLTINDTLNKYKSHTLSKLSANHKTSPAVLSMWLAHLIETINPINLFLMALFCNPYGFRLFKSLLWLNVGIGVVTTLHRAFQVPLAPPIAQDTHDSYALFFK